MKQNSLVVYYTHSANTRKIAEIICGISLCRQNFKERPFRLFADYFCNFPRVCGMGVIQDVYKRQPLRWCRCHLQVIVLPVKVFYFLKCHCDCLSMILRSRPLSISARAIFSRSGMIKGTTHQPSTALSPIGPTRCV